MRFCPVCDNYLYLQTAEATEAGETPTLTLLCRHCGYDEKMEPKSSDEALVLETVFSAAGAAGGKQTVSALNDYTKLDPTLPRLKTIACPNAACPSQADPASRDILYIKTDAKNLKYQYACTVCGTQWGS
jgi:DNA-directed RNA polymerase subunit M/transcription elongation factor TFIIS